MGSEQPTTEFLYDFFYVDYERVASFISQIDRDGLLTSRKITDGSIKVKGGALGGEIPEIVK